MKTYNGKIKFKIEYDTVYEKYVLCVYDYEIEEWEILDHSYFIFVLKLFAKIYAWFYRREDKIEEFEL